MSVCLSVSLLLLAAVMRNSRSKQGKCAEWWEDLDEDQRGGVFACCGILTFASILLFSLSFSLCPPRNLCLRYDAML